MAKPTKQVFLDEINKAVAELNELWPQKKNEPNWVRFQDRYKRWKHRWSSWIGPIISQEESERFLEIEQEDPDELFWSKWGLQEHYIKRFRNYLEGLKEDVSKYSSDDARGPGEKFFAHDPVERDLSGKHVFIVHGHDGASLGQLTDLLKDEFGLQPIILKKKAGKSRHILMKFEEEANKAVFALVLLTPDDIVKTEKEEFAQARPNAIFELGWFFRHLGRERVRIIMRKGTKIHSDLDGIERLEFHEDVDEIFAKLKRELEASGYDAGKKEFDS